MLIRLLSVVTAAWIAAGMTLAAQSSGSVNINVARAHANDGRQMYTTYCATCHGATGRGDGPVAASLRVAPRDLTVLSRNNDGKFPTFHVQSVLRFGSGVPAAHGSVEMPVWGPLFSEMNHTVLSPAKKRQ